MSPEIESSALYKLIREPTSAPSSRPSTMHDSAIGTPSSDTPRDYSGLPAPESLCLEDSLTNLSQVSLADSLHLSHTPLSSPRCSTASTAPTTPVSSTSMVSPLLMYPAPRPPLCTAINSPKPSGIESHGLVRRLSHRARNLSRVARRNHSVPPPDKGRNLGPALVRNTSVRNGSPHPGRHTEREGLYTRDTYSTPSDKDGGLENSHDLSRFYPVYPTNLVNGSKIFKISKKGIKKPVTLFANPETGTIAYMDGNHKYRTISIDHLEQVRCGLDTDQYRSELNASPEEADLWFTLICSLPERNMRTKIVHMVANNSDEVKAWTTTLTSIMRFREQGIVSLMSFNDRAVADFWRNEAAAFSLDSQDLLNVSMPFDKLLKMCRYLHIHAPERQLRVRFQLCCVDGAAQLNYHQFCTVLSFIRKQSGIHHVYYQVAKDKVHGMDLNEFLDFIRDVQREDVASDPEHWMGVFRHFAVDSNGQRRFTEASMFNFLRSKYNTPLKKNRSLVYDQPMNRYFISSSHNTYLLGRQIAGSSSVEGYISALIGGCRCVEIDCWDGPNGEPQVLHGRTLTSAVTFESCIIGINKWAFYASQYPLWISLEVHTNPAQQTRMVEIMKSVFGERLISEPLDPASETLPSPEELKGRILIKVKKPVVKDDSAKQMQIPMHSQPSQETFQSGRRRGNSLTSSPPTRAFSDIVMPHSMPPSPVLHPFGRNRTFPVRTLDLPPLCYPDSDSVSETSTENRTVKVLGDLGVYCTGVKFRGFESPEAKAFNHIFSFKEDSFEKCSRTKALKRAMELHNRNYLMRVYPSQFRVTSNNFDPLAYWRRGVQMAALNWQTFDLGMQLNRAMFSGNGDNSGYVLKPAALRHHEMSSPALPFNYHKRKELSMNITIISAQQLICPANVRVMNPYVEIEVFHANAARYKTNADAPIPEEMSASQTFRTRIICDNGYNPHFQQTFNIDVTTRFEELTFIRFSVKLSNDGTTYPSKDNTLAVYMAKAVNLSNGYRFLPLWDRKGAQFLFSNLLCNIQFNYVRPITLIGGPSFGEGASTTKLRGISTIGKVFSRSNSTSTSPRSTFEKDPLIFPPNLMPSTISGQSVVSSSTSVSMIT